MKVTWKDRPSISHIEGLSFHAKVTWKDATWSPSSASSGKQCPITLVRLAEWIVRHLKHGLGTCSEAQLSAMA